MLFFSFTKSCSRLNTQMLSQRQLQCTLCDMQLLAYPVKQCTCTTSSTAPTVSPLYPDINIIASYEPVFKGYLHTFTPAFNSLMFNTKILAIFQFSSPCSSFTNNMLQRKKYLIHGWVGKAFCTDFCKMNSELGAMTLHFGELNTRLEVKAVLLPALQPSCHITLRKSLYLVLL